MNVDLKLIFIRIAFIMFYNHLLDLKFIEYHVFIILFNCLII